MSYFKFFLVYGILLGFLLNELAKQFEAASHIHRAQITLENKHE